MKYSVILLLIVFTTSSCISLNKPILSISIPKCGTNLLVKCLHLITQTQQATHDLLDESNLTQEDFKFPLTIFISHLTYNKTKYAQVLKKNFTTLFIYRDPRDQAVSFTFFAQLLPGYAEKIFPDLNIPIKDVPFTALLMDFITNGSWIYPNWISSQPNITNFYHEFLPWKDMPDVYALRFEDLVGPEGGGTEEAQARVISDIAQHVGIAMTQDRVKEITYRLFGHRWTFREGKVGSWKKYFTPEHKQAFKQVAGQLLIDLGYEKDLNW